MARWWCARAGWPAVAMAILIIAGCTTSPPSRFYTLESMAEPIADGVSPAAAPPTVVIGSIDLPEYLDRPQVVTRPEPFVASLAEFDRWIEPLDTMIPRVVAENLATLLQSDRIVVNPRVRPPLPAYQLDISILRFDIDRENRAVLIARWTLVNRGTDQVIATRQTSAMRPAASASYESRVRAMSEVVAVLCREIAEQLRRP